MITGQHYIGGHWQGQPVAEHCSYNPAQNAALDWCFAEAGSAELQQITELANEAFHAYRQTSAQQRAEFLQTIAQEIEALGNNLFDVVMAETALPLARVQGECARTCNQLRLFAAGLLESRSGVFEPAEPDRVPAPKPALRLQQLPLGPVLVFAASNFPLAFSVAGGDTASALAAGCPVIVKAHNAHPATSELITRAIATAISRCRMPAGVFTLVHARAHRFSEQLLQHSLIKAVAFTGSEQLGLHFQRLIWQRQQPVPFYGELGSQNPLFVLPDYLAEQPLRFAEQLMQSVLMGMGQFCTRPGLVFIPESTEAEALCNAAAELCRAQSAGTLLTPRIAQAYREQSASLQQLNDVTLLAAGSGDEGGCQVLPRLFRVTAAAFIDQAQLRQEIFGPATVFIECKDVTQMQMLATTLQGQLTATVYAKETEFVAHKGLLRQLELIAGRVIFNQMPTGVEVCAAMNHGGPFPASTDARYTAVGSQAIQRFLRPVCYQNLPASLLTQE